MRGRELRQRVLSELSEVTARAYVFADFRRKMSLMVSSKQIEEFGMATVEVTTDWRIATGGQQVQT